MSRLFSIYLLNLLLYLNVQCNFFHDVMTKKLKDTILKKPHFFTVPYTKYLHLILTLLLKVLIGKYCGQYFHF